MKLLGVFVIVATLAASGRAATIDHGVTDGELYAALRSGVERAVRRSVDLREIGEPLQKQLEDDLVHQLFKRLTFRLRQFDAAVDGSTQLAKDYLQSAFKTVALRSRQPAESIQSALDSLQQDYRGRASQLLRSVGLIKPRSQVSPFMSALDLETLTNEIMQTLLQDPAFLSLYGWIASLPAKLHDIFDELFSNKTFGEIFDMLGRKQRHQLADLWPLLSGEEALAGTFNQETDLIPAGDLVEDSLLEARPLVARIVASNVDKVHRSVQQLVQTVDGFQVVGRDRQDQILNVGLQFLFLQIE